MLIQQSAHDSDQDSKVKRQLECYLTWLVEQEEVTWADEVADRGISQLHLMKLEETSLDELTDAWLYPLREREQQSIRWR